MNLLLHFIFFSVSLQNTVLFGSEFPELQKSNIKAVWNDANTMLLTYSEGSAETIQLQPISNIPGETTPCLFSGLSNKDIEAVIAVSGCHNSSSSTISIASNHAPDGHIDLLIDEGETFEVLADPKDIDSTSYPPSNNNNVDNPILAETRPGIVQPSKVILKTQIWYDKSLLNHYGGSHQKTKDVLSKVIAHTNTYLSHKSLKTKVVLKVSGKYEFLNEDIKATTSDLVKLSNNWNKIRMLYSYFVRGDEDEGQGVAFLRSACSRWMALNINELAWKMKNAELNLARCFAHELGHNIGMRHDAEFGTTSPCYGKGIMSGGPLAWTSCNNKDFSDYYTKKGWKCMHKAD